MARARQSSAAPARRRRAAGSDTLRTAADDFLSRFGGLVEEIVSLREALEQAQQDNLRLRAELAEGIDLLRDARALVVRAEAPPRRRGRGGTRPAAPAPSRGRSRVAAVPARAERSRTRPANGRVTPAAVTADVVRAVIGRMGSATAGEIAEQITNAGTPVSGRAIRHIAKVAGAVARPGEAGRMVYTLS
ncbi:MAG: hypothetical protein JWM18_3252 [Chloroflexi bacterium]|jgi:hypothetical protein|nr:hypothetical protein [Chloroflexota bacterium]